MVKYQKNSCIGCRICEVICSMEHEQVINPKKARVRYRDDWPKIGHVDICRNCKARKCVKSCEQGALTVAEEGYVKLDRSKCNKCLACSKACSFGRLPLDNQYPLFCDTCNGAYQCTQWCPTKALQR